MWKIFHVTRSLRSPRYSFHSFLLAAACLMAAAAVLFGGSPMAANEKGKSMKVHAVSYGRGAGPTAVSYFMEASGGKVSLSRTVGKESCQAYVHPALLSRLSDWMEAFGVSGWRGFNCERQERLKDGSYSLYLAMESGQSINVYGDMFRKGGAPGRFPEAEKALLALFDEALGPADTLIPPIPATGLTYFAWTGSGMSPKQCQIYELYWRKDPGGMVLRLLRRRGSQVLDCPVTDDERTEFEELFKKLELDRWNGFYGTNRRVLDGEGFILNVRTADGKKVYAEGYMRFPKGYREARQAIMDFFEKILTERGETVSGA
ncbi:MAG: hypothetical protein K5657_00515 [Desulfovibrio sp.]|nr:hypothetical protein [Desulfovibrio sp.]